jgi:hypothetical protein
MVITPEMAQALLKHCRGVQQNCMGIRFVVDEPPLDRSKCGISRLLQDQRPRPEPSHSPRIDSPEEKFPPTPAADLVKRVQNGSLGRLFITGEGGMGKTEFSRMLAWELATSAIADLQRLTPGLQDTALPLIPFWMELNVLETAAQLCDYCLKLKGAADSVFPESLRKHAVIILDGLDELRSTVSRTTFDLLLRDLVLSGASVILTGRLGSLGALVGEFRKDQQYEIQPLTPKDIDTYIHNYFQSIGKDERGNELISAIARCQAVMRPMLQQPFMLALTCFYFAEPSHEIHLPDDPADLLEKCLSQLFWRRKEHGHLTLMENECMDALGALFAHSIDQGFRLDWRDAKDVLVRNLSIPDPEPEAERWLKELAPASGVLMGGGRAGYVRFTNRVVAEYLAARWIVAHGLVINSWPIKPPDPAKPLTVEDQIMRVCSKYIWSVQHRGLFRWLALVLGKERPALLVRIARWVLNHLQGGELDAAGKGWRDDPRRTFLLRFFDVMAGFRDSSDHFPPGTGDQVQGLYHIVQTGSEWWIDEDQKLGVSSLSAELRKPYRAALCDNLNKERWKKNMMHLVDALAAGWLGDKAAGEAVWKRLKEEEDGCNVAELVGALALSWPEYKQAAGEAVWEKLEKEKDGSNVADLAYVLASGWPEYKQAAGEAVWKKLKEEEDGYNIAKLAGALALGWSEYKQAAGEVVLTKLEKEEDFVAVLKLADALAAGWPGDKAAGEAVWKKLEKEEDGSNVADLAYVLASGWPGDKAAGEAVWKKLEEKMNGSDVADSADALASKWARDKTASETVWRKLEEDQNRYSVAPLASALALGWPEYQQAAGEAVWKKLKDEEDFPTVLGLAGVLASRWPGDKAAGEVVRTKLENETNRSYVANLAYVLAVGWPGDKAAGEAVWKKLKDEEDGYNVADLADALELGWPEYKQAAGKAVRKKLKEEMDESRVGVLTAHLERWWPWDNTIQLALARCPVTLGYWDERWVVLIARDFSQGRELAEWRLRCGWQFPLHDQKFSQYHDTNGLNQPSKPQSNPTAGAFILAPREQFWPGLDPMLDVGAFLYAGEDLKELAIVLGALEDTTSKEQGRLVLGLHILKNALACGIIKGLEVGRMGVTQETLWKGLRLLHEDHREEVKNTFGDIWPFEDCTIWKSAAKFISVKAALMKRADLAVATHRAIWNLFDSLNHRTPSYDPEQVGAKARANRPAGARLPIDRDRRRG